MREKLWYDNQNHPIIWELHDARFRLSLEGSIWESEFVLQTVGTSTFAAYAQRGTFQGDHSGYFLLCADLPTAAPAAPAPRFNP
jgi:hypothetical protein